MWVGWLMIEEDNGDRGEKGYDAVVISKRYVSRQ